MRDLLSPDNAVMQLITRIVNTVWLNILWLICCIPVVTAGASTTALFYVTLKMVRNEEGNLTEQFFRAFRENFAFATKVWLILLGLGILLGVDGYVLYHMRYENAFWTMITAIFCVAAVAYLIVLMYVFPLMARFENTILRTLLNSIMIGMRYLLCTVSMAAIYFLMILVVVRFFTPAIVFGMGLCAFLCSFLLVRILETLAGKGGEEAAREQDEESGREI